MLRFRKQAHAVSELLGNHYFLSEEECDTCNAAGSILEDDLAKHLTVARALGGFDGKKGPIGYRFGKQRSSISVGDDGHTRVIDHYAGDDAIKKRRTRDGVSYQIRIPGYRPLNVVRAFARLAMMLAPYSILDQLEHLRRWIRRETVWERPSFHEGFLPGPGLRLVRAAVEMNMEAAPGEPLLRVGLAYLTALFSVHLPGPDMLITAVPPPPSGLRSQYPPFHVTWRTFATDGRIELVARGKVDTIDLHVPSLAALPEPSHEEIAMRAYFKWQARGGPAAPDGALDDWLDAEQDILWEQVPMETLSADSDEYARG